MDRLKDFGAILVILLLTGSFRWFSPEQSQGGLLSLVPVPELLLVMVLLVVSRTKPLGWLGRLGVPILGWLLLWNAGESFYRYFYRERFSPVHDLRYLSGLVSMLSGSDFWMSFTGTVLLAVFLFLVVLVLGRLLSGWLQHILKDLDGRWIPLLLIAASLQLVLIPGEVPSAILAEGADPEPVPVFFSGESAIPGEAIPEETGFADADVHIFIIESYGHTLFSNPSYREVRTRLYPVLDRELEADGWQMRSGFMRSPAFGGRSWLADATILTGIQIDTQELYDRLPASGGRNLTHFFEDAGYFRLLAAPGTSQAGEQWRNYYRFDRYLFRYDFDYQGPFVSFGAMPDQFLLYRSGELIRELEEPVFAVYTLVSSHVPFEVIPEYVPDWDLLGDGSIFSRAYLRRFDNNWLSGSEYPEGFIAGISYSLQSIRGYLNRYVEDGALAVIIGDHQPRIPISERDSTYSVPVHFLSRRPELLEILPDAWLSRSFVPKEISGEHPDMAELAFLLRDLAGGAGEVDGVRVF